VAGVVARRAAHARDSRARTALTGGVTRDTAGAAGHHIDGRPDATIDGVLRRPRCSPIGVTAMALRAPQGRPSRPSPAGDLSSPAEPALLTRVPATRRSHSAGRRIKPTTSGDSR
jgi:hypothetical protein